MEAKYKIAEDGKSITCLLCGMTSHNYIDVGMRYCGNCHKWIGEFICDFCLGEYPYGCDYRAVSQITGELEDGRIVMDRDLLWVACIYCKDLIDRGDWEGMLARAIAGCDAKWGMERSEIRMIREKLIFCYQGVFGEKFTVTE